MHYYKSNNEIMQYSIFSNDIALIMHYCALLKRSDTYIPNESLFKTTKVYNSTVHIKIFFLLSQSGKTFQCSITLAEQYYNWGT